LPAVALAAEVRFDAVGAGNALADVSASAAQLPKEHPRAEALRRWRTGTPSSSRRNVAWRSRCARSSSRRVERNAARAGILAAVDSLLTAGAVDGSLRGDARADDVVTSLLGISLASGSREQSRRMLDLLLDGLVATR
jgi:hypothetical protein